VGADVVRLAQEVGQPEAEIEPRIAPVDHLVVKQNQPPFVDQDVLRAVVAVDQGDGDRSRLCQQSLDEGRRRRHPARGVSVVRLQPQRLEEGAVGEDRLDLRPPLGRPAVDRPQQPGELVDVPGVEPPRQQHPLPVLVRRRHRRHRQQVLLAILEHQGNRRSRRRQLGQPAQPQRLPLDPLRRAEPIDRHPQLGERLLQHPPLAPRPLDQHRPVRHPAGQYPDLRRLVGRDPAAAPQIAQQRVRLLDVEFAGHDQPCQKPKHRGSQTDGARWGALCSAPAPDQDARVHARRRQQMVALAARVGRRSAGAS